MRFLIVLVLATPVFGQFGETEPVLDDGIEERHQQMIYELAKEGVPDGWTGPLNSKRPPTPHPSDVWRRAYRQIHGKVWKPGNDPDAEKHRGPWELHEWRIAKGYVKNDNLDLAEAGVRSSNAALAQNTRLLKMIDELIKENEELKRRIRQLESTRMNKNFSPNTTRRARGS